MAYLQKRTHSLTAAITGKSEIQVAASYTVLVAKQGATVKTAGAASPIAVDDVGQFAANDKFIVNNDTTKYKTVTTVDTSAKTIAYSGAAISVSTQDRLVNLGADTGVSSPNYDAGLTIYSDRAANQTTTNPVTADSSGNYSFWIDDSYIWDELIRNTSGTPVSNIQDVQFADEMQSFRTASAADLSGTATTLVIWHNDTGHACVLETATLLYTEASSADAGVTVEIGKESDRDYYYTGTTEISKVIWYENSVTLLQTAIPSGDTLTFYSPGAKVGTGEIMCIIQVSFKR